jgi:hypothetical protein
MTVHKLGRKDAESLIKRHERAKANVFIALLDILDHSLVSKDYDTIVAKLRGIRGRSDTISESIQEETDIVNAILRNRNDESAINEFESRKQLLLEERDLLRTMAFQIDKMLRHLDLHKSYDMLAGQLVKLRSVLERLRRITLEMTKDSVDMAALRRAA